ncbi:MAG: hypothetical protein QOI20_3419 [Acidimicrobiaceae bacterium]|jgi:hypothetical protein|nr:hypothetical protein [Acidimicrobiaceae bacterium]
MGLLLATVGLGTLVAVGLLLMVRDGRKKISVLRSLNGQTVTVGLGRGIHWVRTCTGRFVIGDSKRSMTFIDDDPDFQRGALGIRDPDQGELVRLGQIRWIRDAGGTVRLGNPRAGGE